MTQVEYNFIEPALPSHLGGHENETHVDEGAIDYLIEKFGIKSAYDVGCGPGEMVALMRKKGIDCLGIDGDFVVTRPDEIKEYVAIHDYATGPFPRDFNHPRDLAWSCEFVEHVDKCFMPNFLDTFKQCKYVAMTHAVPGQGGHHHVNCMPAEYWFGALEAIGFELLVTETNEMRARSTMKMHYIRQQGFLFRNRAP